MDKSWVHTDRNSQAYYNGVQAFIEYANSHGKKDYKGNLRCPCINCKNFDFRDKDTIYEHLICDGMLRNYTTWFHHGEGIGTTSIPEIRVEIGDDDDNAGNAGNHNGDNINGMLHDLYPNVNEDMDGVADETCSESPIDSIAAQFHKLLEQSKKELYPGCEKTTMLSFLIRFWQYKCLGGWSNKTFSMMLDLLRESLPDGCNLPENFTQCKKVISELGLYYNKIDACRNDCMLYWKETSNLQSCTICGASRWIKVRPGKKKNTPAKILRYFPLKPRLQRLYMSSKVAEDMRWHEEKRTKDGVLRYPADSMAWKHFDETNPTFAKDLRNVKLGLASDGFNPFRTMSSTHSTWPVVLIPYNLPPWLCMKQPHIILSLIIPGPSSPGNDIDVYLRPLVEELKELWAEGVDTFDSFSKETFKMRAAVLWTISDFPGFAMLSGWSTKGKLACPSCHEHTCHKYLKNGRKICYMGHRRFLPLNHRFRKLKKDFDGTIERRTTPIPLSGKVILRKLKGIPHKYGKEPKDENAARPSRRKRAREVESSHSMPNNWKKLSILYELPYWSTNLLQHNLDVMHIEKNVCDNVVGTLLELDRKSKDSLKARFDLVDMGVRYELHPKLDANKNKYYIPPACYSMDKAGKELFCNILKSLKIPEGYSSNFGRCINVRERKISGLKSHDSHVIMQQFLPLAIRNTLPKKVSSILIELSTFFRDLCSKACRPEELRRLEERIPVILCNLERIFPPTFFDIMVHLPIHLPSEALLGGPVHYRWMYPIERYLCTLKSYVRNRAQPEGSIAEGYIAEECLTFLTRYLDNVETRLDRPPRYKDNSAIGGVEGFIIDPTEKKRAHDYILFNDENVFSYLKQHESYVNLISRKLSACEKQKKHKEQFAGWFKEEIARLKRANRPFHEGLESLAQGPWSHAKRFVGYTVNGYVFKTVAQERDSKTQNSGVMLNATAMCLASTKDKRPVSGEITYYGRLTDIIELSYPLGHKVLLFKCDWVDVARGKGIKTDELGFTLVNFTHLLASQKEEPYVLASQVKQVFYVEDPIDPGWHVVVNNKPRDTFDLGGGDDQLLDSESYGRQLLVEGDEINLVREDVPGINLQEDSSSLR